LSVGLDLSRPFSDDLARHISKEFMKGFQPLLPIGFSVLTAIVLFGQTAPRTLPSKGPKWIGPPLAGSDLNGVEFRPFHFSSKEYTALLSRRDVLSGPDWNPALPLPVSLGRIEQAARSELPKEGS